MEAITGCFEWPSSVHSQWSPHWEVASGWSHRTVSICVLLASPPRCTPAQTSTHSFAIHTPPTRRSRWASRPPRRRAATPVAAVPLLPLRRLPPCRRPRRTESSCASEGGNPAQNSADQRRRAHTSLHRRQHRRCRHRSRPPTRPTRGRLRRTAAPLPTLRPALQTKSSTRFDQIRGAAAQAASARVATAFPCTAVM